MQISTDEKLDSIKGMRKLCFPIRITDNRNKLKGNVEVNQDTCRAFYIG